MKWQSDITKRINSIMATIPSGALESGRKWYTEAHGFVESLSSKYSFPVQGVAGIVAVLSPANHWYQNLKDTESVLRDGDSAVVTTYSANREKALRILHGDDPFNVVKGAGRGFKVNSFFINILDPLDDHYVTIDRWILRSFGIIEAKEQKAFFDSPKQYEFLAGVIRRKAKDYNLIPCQLQAAIWETVREVEK